MAQKLYYYTEDLEGLTGIKAATWRYWASVGEGPPSHLLGRRRVWRKDLADAWLAAQEGRTRRADPVVSIGAEPAQGRPPVVTVGAGAISAGVSQTPRAARAP